MTTAKHLPSKPMLTYLLGEWTRWTKGRELKRSPKCGEFDRDVFAARVLRKANGMADPVRWLGRYLRAVNTAARASNPGMDGNAWFVNAILDNLEDPRRSTS